MKAAGLIRPPPVAMAGIEGVKTGRKRSDGEACPMKIRPSCPPCCGIPFKCLGPSTRTPEDLFSLQAKFRAVRAVRKGASRETDPSKQHNRPFGGC